MKIVLIGLSLMSSFNLTAMGNELISREMLSSSAPFYCEVTCAKRTVKILDLLKEKRSVHTLYDRKEGSPTIDVGGFFMTTVGGSEKLPSAITIPSTSLDSGYAIFSHDGKLDINLQKKPYWGEAFKLYMKSVEEVLKLANNGEAVVENCKIISYKVNDQDQSIESKVQTEFKTDPFVYQINVVPLHVQFPGEVDPRYATINFLTKLEYHPAPANFNLELAQNHLERLIKIGLCRN